MLNEFWQVTSIYIMLHSPAMYMVPGVFASVIIWPD